MAYVIKEINRLTGKAIHKYALLEEGDRILAAVSGGCDSLVMLHFLVEWSKKAPIHFELFPVFLDMGFGDKKTWAALNRHFQQLRLPYYMEETNFGPLAHGPFNKGKSPCFICSLNRRKRLFELTRVLSCNKIALGHNLDDLIETLFMNMCFSGEMSTMLPRQEMFKGIITLIRPLALADEDKIRKVSRLLGLPVCKNQCPSSGRSKRQDIKEFLSSLYTRNRKIKGNIKRALFHMRPEYLPG